MSEYTNHLYIILHPNPALVASQLDAEAFAKHYRTGSTRYYSGRVIFADVDVNFRNDYFDIQGALDALKPHEDGSPKATKFIRTYRVLEHVDLAALGRLHITSADGNVISLKSAPYDKRHEPGFIRVYAEIAPMTMMALSTYDLPTFAEFISNPNNPKGAPKVFLTQIDLTIADFLRDFEENPFMAPPLPEVHPAKLRDAILALQHNDAKKVKSISLRADLERLRFSRIRHGFVFGAGDHSLFYPMPTLAEIERTNFAFFRSM